MFGRFVGLLAALGLLAGCQVASVDESTLDAAQAYSNVSGVKAGVGEPAPDFTLPDGDGRPVHLADYRGQRVMLVFYRGDWCPYCMDQLDNYQSLLPELENLNIRLLAISPDDSKAIQNTRRRFGQDYTFLSDADREVIRRYGIISSENLPHPALFLIDEHGVLRWYYASSDHKTRPSSAQVDRIIRKIFTEKQ